MTQMNLGAALRTLGERDSGTGKLEDAAAAYRAALEEWTQERVSLDWAATQNNLGIALFRLGERQPLDAPRGQSARRWLLPPRSRGCHSQNFVRRHSAADRGTAAFEQKLRERCVLITTNSALSGARRAHVTGFGVPEARSGAVIRTCEAK
jgi:hypothetical protein